MVRYGGIEPPPVSHERQAAFVSVYRIEAARNVKESKARYLQAEKEENAKKGHVSEAACIGLPFGFSDDTILHHAIVKPQCNDSAMFSKAQFIHCFAPQNIDHAQRVIHIFCDPVPREAIEIVLVQHRVCFFVLDLGERVSDLKKQPVADRSLLIGAALRFLFAFHSPGKALAIFAAAGGALRLWVMCRVASCASARRSDSK